MKREKSYIMDIGKTDYSTSVESCWVKVVEMQTIMVDTNQMRKAADKVLGRQSAAFV